MDIDDIFIEQSFNKPLIDAVVIWCDSTENHIFSEFSTIKSYDAKRIGKRESLKYTLRGLYYNLPWLNNIFLVTNNQWPKYICEEQSSRIYPKIVRVDHKQIHPAKKSMYSAFAIELCINNIPNLSEYFLLANDDMFVIKPMSISEWLTSDKKGIYRYRKSNIKNYIKSNKGYRYWDILRQYELIKNIYPHTKFIRPSHQIQILNKKAFNIANIQFPALYENTMNIKGRPEQDRITRTIIEYISLNENLCVGVPNSEDCLYMESNPKESIAKRIKKLSSININNSKKLLCINNIFDLDEIPLLEKLLPNKIPSEI